MKDKKQLPGSNDELRASVHERFDNALQTSWGQAARNQTDQLTEAEINAEIREVRKTKRRS